MRVLLLHSRYLSGAASGENRVLEEESRLLRDAGHDVTLWSPEPEVGGALATVRTAGNAVWSRSAAQHVASLVRRNRIEIVHVHNLFPTLSPSVLRAARSSGAAVVMTLHNYRLMCLPANFLRDGRPCEDCLGHLPWRGVVHRCYRDSALGSATLAGSLGAARSAGSFDAVTRFLAVSEFVRVKHIQGGIAPERIVVKPNFTWPAERRTGPGEYLLFLGRLSHEKGVDTILRAAARSGEGCPLVVVGDGPDAEALRRDAPANVTFRGQVAASEVPAILARGRALLVPSRWYEAAPRSIIEAYAAGVPVIASDIGALPEAVADGETGLLAPPDDPSSWAARMTELVDDGTSLRLGEAAFARWEQRFSPERGVRDLEEAYSEAIAAR
ncbi:MAG: glycosyltransferase family 4 protein [Actinomycetota bacterium]